MIRLHLWTRELTGNPTTTTLLLWMRQMQRGQLPWVAPEQSLPWQTYLLQHGAKLRLTSLEDFEGRIREMA